MAEPDYYGLLGVERTAELREIRAKFRAKVLTDHPDKGGDPKHFQMLNKAYNVLADPEKRKRYDSTGRTTFSAEEEFAATFGDGRMSQEQRPKEADAAAVINMSERVAKGASEHEDGFAEWLRQRDQAEMVMTDRDFMKTALYNSAEMAATINHTSAVQHVLGSPKTDAYGQPMTGPVQVQAKPRRIKKTLDHDEVLVRMLAVPLDDAMVYAELNSSDVCLGYTGVGRIEQVGTRIDDFKQEDCVLVLPKPTKFSAGSPIGTSRTLLTCQEEDILRIPSEVLEELTPEQICLAPTIVCAYVLLETFGAKLKPGDSILLNAAHMSAAGCSLLQLCRLLKLKPLCILDLPGAPKNKVKGEYGSKSAWQDADARAVAPPSVRQHYERISEWLVSMGAEEVFPDAVSLLRWRDRNQRMLPKLGLDGIATSDSVEQLIHCLQSGDKDSQCVVYGHGAAKPVEVDPPLLSSWGGTLLGFSVARWVHSLSANAKKMMAVMENITKLVRANKFALDTVLYKVGEDAISDAFARAADASDSAQVVLIFPTLAEELTNAGARTDDHAAYGGGAADAASRGGAEAAKADAERERLKTEWLNGLFTPNSVAAQNPEGPLPIALEAGNMVDPKSLIVWIGDQDAQEQPLVRNMSAALGSAGLLCLSWAQHPAGEGLAELDLAAPGVADGTWYARTRAKLENEDLDQLHDIELLGRGLVDVVEGQIAKLGLQWRNVIFTGFGKGAGVAMYAVLARLIPQPFAGGIFFNAVVPFPSYLAEKAKGAPRAASPMKLFTIWGSQDRATPAGYRQLLAQVLNDVPQVSCTPDTLPDNDHSFNQKSVSVMSSLLPLIMPR
mmetsp:Transcript_53099/g.153156  ORF Transcript_53099/g.153156 Transcript_53099/m.153156 type:complete len:840 (+) Transcript_53099:69-2588(+)